MLISDWHVAQLNVGTTRYPTDDPRLDGFMSRLDEINALAERSPGFVWRLQSESGNATDIDVGGDPSFIINLSVWETIDALFEFAYRSAHRDVMAKRRQWFEKPTGAYQVLWWIPRGHEPTPDEALARLALIQREGPGPQAFEFKSRYGPPDVASAGFTAPAPRRGC